jgi:hypothetical protein
MIIEKTSPLTGIRHSLDLPVTNDQMRRFYRGESHIQFIFPELSPADREFILTGITNEEWLALED